MKAIVAILSLLGFSYITEATELKRVTDIKDLVCLSETAQETKITVIKGTTSIDGRFSFEEYSQQKSDGLPDLAKHSQKFMFLKKSGTQIRFEYLDGSVQESFLELYKNEMNELKAAGSGISCSINLK